MGKSISILSHPNNDNFSTWLSSDQYYLGYYGWNDITNFYSVFADIILRYTDIDTSTLITDNNSAYNVVLQYYKNGQSDSAILALSTILNSPITSTTKSAQSFSCGCNGGLNTAELQTSCVDTYRQGISEHLKQALGSAQFYADWMYNYNPKTRTYKPNIWVIEPLIQILKDLIKKVKDGELWLEFNQSKKKYYCSCASRDNSEQEANLKILENYLKVLNWVKNCQMDANINKIKLYGEAFAELLPKLSF